MEELLKTLAGPIFVVVISGGIMALFRQARKADDLRFQGLEKQNAETRKLIDDHRELCEEIPNSLLLAKLEEISKKQDFNYANITSRFDKVETRVSEGRDAIIEHKAALKHIQTKLKI